jgi:L-iditol 2-dehydrogenase
MKAAVLYGREEIRVESLEEAALLVGEVRVRIGAALTCGTDLKVYRRGYHARMLTPPCVFGHELAGTLVEVAPGAVGWFVGDRWFVPIRLPVASVGAVRGGRRIFAMIFCF